MTTTTRVLPLLVLITGQYRSGGGIVAEIVNRLGFQPAVTIYVPTPANGWRSDWTDPALLELCWSACMPGEAIRFPDNFDELLREHLRKRLDFARALHIGAELPAPPGICLREPTLAMLMPEVMRAAADLFRVLVLWTTRPQTQIDASVRRSYKSIASRYLRANEMIRATAPDADMVVDNAALRCDPVAVVSKIAHVLGAYDANAVAEAAKFVKRS